VPLVIKKTAIILKKGILPVYGRKSKRFSVAGEVPTFGERASVNGTVKC